MVNFNQLRDKKISYVEMDIPFLIRLMEYSREDAKTDEDLHFAAEKMEKCNHILTMADYNYIFGKKK